MIAAYVSGHGFGHATRVGEVLRVLREAAPRLPLAVLSSAPEELFRSALGAGFVYYRRECDVGLVQRDALRIDEAGTAAAWAAFASGWDGRVDAEAARLRALGVRLVLGDVPPLAFAAAARAGLPAVALANFSWDWIYRHLGRRQPALMDAAEHCARAYAAAELLLRLPFAGDLSAFRRVADVPLVARRPKFTREEARRRLGLQGDPRPLVLLSFGGLGLPAFDPFVLAGLESFRFAVSAGCGALPPNVQRVSGAELAGAGLGYVDLVGASEVVVTKPGYGIVSDAAGAGTRVLFTERGDFPEYPILVEQMPRYVACRPIGNAALLEGRLEPALSALLREPPPATPPLDGARYAAERLLALVDGP